MTDLDLRSIRTRERPNRESSVSENLNTFPRSIPDLKISILTHQIIQIPVLEKRSRIFNPSHEQNSWEDGSTNLNIRNIGFDDAGVGIFPFSDFEPGEDQEF